MESDLKFTINDIWSRRSTQRNSLTLLHSEWPKLVVLAILSAIGLKNICSSRKVDKKAALSEWVSELGCNIPPTRSYGVGSSVTTLPLLIAGPRGTVGSASDSLAKGPRLIIQSGHMLFFIHSFRWFKKSSCQLLVKIYVQSIGNCLGDLKKGVVRLTDHPDMTIDVYCGC